MHNFDHKPFQNEVHAFNKEYYSKEEAIKLGALYMGCMEEELNLHTRYVYHGFGDIGEGSRTPDWILTYEPKKNSVEVWGVCRKPNQVAKEDNKSSDDQSSDDLISRKKLLECICTAKDGKRIPERDCDNFEISLTLKEIKEIIRKQPTVYCEDEVNSALEELETYKSLAPRDLVSEKQKNDRAVEYSKGFDCGLKTGYNKALDDFVKFANTMPTVEEEDGAIRPMWLEEMAEKLKAGRNE